MIILRSTTASNVYRDGLWKEHSGIQRSLLIENMEVWELDQEQEMLWGHKLIGQFPSSSKLSRVLISVYSTTETQRTCSLFLLDNTTSKKENSLSTLITKMYFTIKILFAPAIIRSTSCASFMFLPRFSHINLLVFYHKCRSLNCCATHYLFCEAVCSC